MTHSARRLTHTGSDGARVGEATRLAGFSTCAHAYALSRAGLAYLLGLKLERAVMPVDDVLPALYAAHPHPVAATLLPRSRGSDRKPLRAVAFDEDLLWQLSSLVPGRCEGVHLHAGASAEQNSMDSLGSSDSNIANTSNTSSDSTASSDSDSELVRQVKKPQGLDASAGTWHAKETSASGKGNRSDVKRQRLMASSVISDCNSKAGSGFIYSTKLLTLARSDIA
eukprot:SAG11_NODE_1988_length_3961_cov_2.373900_3_plen_225_part_00